MRKTIVIIKWELKKIITNWRKALTVFLLPAVLMLIALNLFPALLNYVSTGSFGKKPIVTINAPRSFKRFVESDSYDLPYTFEFFDSDDYDNDEIHQLIRKGRLVVVFDDGHDHEIKRYYKILLKGEEIPVTEAVIHVYYSSSSITNLGRSFQFRDEVIPRYNDFCFENLSGDYKDIGWDRFNTDEFNPVTAININRGTANLAASTIIPGIILLLLYYCVYSLACDMFAAERDRGFLKKLIMTPLPAGSIFGGKAAAITIISFASAVITYLVLFFASWLNFSNDSMSLLPFGMLLTFKEFIAFLLVIPPTAFVMTALCISIIFSLDKMADILMNLQLPLILFLLEFFLQMVRNAAPFTIEFLIPIHGTLCAMRDIFATDIRWPLLIITCLLDIIIGAAIMLRTFRKIGDGSYDN